MSARLNFNQMPYVSWKGQTFVQITSSIRKNTPNIDEILTQEDNKRLFLAPPLKIYRKEIANSAITSCNPRTSTKIDDINSPNGYLIVQSENRDKGLVNTLDINITNNSYERPKTCSALSENDVCLTQEVNARNRVRSSGMVRKKYNPDVNNTSLPNDSYYTNASQYLASRNRTFQQNQYNYVRQGDKTLKPGTNGASENQYSSNSVNRCANAPNSYVPVYYKPNNAQYAQEGAVSASSRITRLKYDTMTTNGSIYATAFGNSVGNAMAYGTEGSYTVKDKIGYPSKNTPVFSPYSDEQKNCMNTKIP